MTIGQYIAKINISIVKEIYAMNERSLFEQIGGTYTEVNGILCPNLVLTSTNYEIGFWGQRYKECLKENHRVIYYSLLTHGKLNSYLHNVDIRAKEQYELLIKQMAESQGITEQLKAENQMLWVQQMNNISNRAREIIYNEFIFSI